MKYVVSAEDYAEYVDLWGTTDKEYVRKKVIKGIVKDVSEVTLPLVPTVSLTSEVRRDVTNPYTGKYDRTAVVITYEIKYAAPKYNDNGEIMHYIMKENHIEYCEVFGGESLGMLGNLCMTFDPWGIEADKLLNEWKLLYSGKTDENGEITLTDWANEGEIRIVEKEIPEGYTAESVETITDLSKGEVTIVNVKIPSQPAIPNTGDSNQIILWVAILAGSAAAVIGLVIVGKKYWRS